MYPLHIKCVISVACEDCKSFKIQILFVQKIISSSKTINISSNRSFLKMCYNINSSPVLFDQVSFYSFFD